jgi:phage shock protein A
MGTFSRVRYVIAANMNALLEKAEDPEKLLRSLIREMEDAGEDARLAAADLLAEQQHLERLLKRLDSESGEWQTRAERAVEAGRDDLARSALASRAELRERQRDAQSEHQALGERVAQLEQDMATLKTKLAEAKLRLKEIHVRSSAPAAKVAARTELSGSERKMRTAMNRFDRLQNQVERLEARVRSYEVGGAAPTPWAAEPAVADPAVEAELEALKAQLQARETTDEKSRDEA